jgi:hypothetical protein
VAAIQKLLISLSRLEPLGAKVTDTAYNLFLLKAMQQILKLIGNFTAVNYYDPHTKAVTVVLSGKTSHVSELSS